MSSDYSERTLGDHLPLCSLYSDCREPTYIAFQKKRKEDEKKSNYFNVSKARYPPLEARDAFGSSLTAPILRNQTGMWQYGKMALISGTPCVVLAQNWEVGNNHTVSFSLKGVLF